MKYLVLILIFCSFKTLGQVNPCVAGQDFRIVVLGSSTAAGSGPSSSDSAWVNRYRTYLEDINPNNEVINLAVGGYNTYRIMPTGFTPPVGRPDPDTLRNITAGLGYSPDAIIVNMPSNDAAAGYSLVEHMFNFDSIVETSLLDSVPIWICTTQPRNFTDTNQLQLQWDVKDSIYSWFNPYVLDFWTTIALPDYTIDPVYDSGDGIHLNDLGHGLLFQRVTNASILDSIYTPLQTPDFSITDIVLEAPSACGDSSQLVSVIVTNAGVTDMNSTDVVVDLVNNTTASTVSQTLVLTSGMQECSVDTLSFVANTYQAGNYVIDANVQNVNDTTASNNLLQTTFLSLGHPTLELTNDTLCEEGYATLEAQFDAGDTVYWFDDLLATVPIAYGSSYTTQWLSSTATLYAEAVRGDLFYKNELFTTLNSNINFNGAMLDLVPSQNIVIDSFNVKIYSQGQQQVSIYQKSGSHLGYEASPGAWVLLDTVTVNVQSATEPTVIPVSAFPVSANDTVGVYIFMSDPLSRLSYQSMGSEQVRTTPELTMITGSGIAYNYSGSYYPRDINAGVFYHYGERPMGDCSTGKIPVTAFVSETEFSLGNDTIIDILDTILLSGPSGMQSYLWSEGTMDSNYQFIASNFGQGVHYVSLDVVDSLGCLHSDQVVIAVADLVSLTEEELSSALVYPNPTTGIVTVEVADIRSLYATSTTGEVVALGNAEQKNIDLGDVESGTYYIHVLTSSRHYVSKVIKAD